MRQIRISFEAINELDEMLQEGALYFDEILIQEKQDLVGNAIKRLALFPDWITREPAKGLRIYNIRKTPFAIAYDVAEYLNFTQFLLG